MTNEIERKKIQEGVTEREKPPRDICDVITKIIAAIPSGLWRVGRPYAPMVLRMSHIAESASFTPPEGQGVMWRALVGTLAEYLEAPPVIDWQVKIQKIMRDEE